MIQRIVALAGALLVAVVVLMPVQAQGSTSKDPAFDIPRMDAAFGKAGSGEGVRVNILRRNWMSDCAQLPRDVFDARMRLAWSEAGLLAHVEVRAPEAHEARGRDAL